MPGEPVAHEDSGATDGVRLIAFYLPQFHPLKRGFDEYFGFLGGAHDYLDAASDKNNPILRGTTPVDNIDYTTDAFGRDQRPIAGSAGPAHADHVDVEHGVRHIPVGIGKSRSCNEQLAGLSEHPCFWAAFELVGDADRSWLGGPPTAHGERREEVTSWR